MRKSDPVLLLSSTFCLLLHVMPHHVISLYASSLVVSRHHVCASWCGFDRGYSLSIACTSVNGLYVLSGGIVCTCDVLHMLSAMGTTYHWWGRWRIHLWCGSSHIAINVLTCSHCWGSGHIIIAIVLCHFQPRHQCPYCYTFKGVQWSMKDRATTDVMAWFHDAPASLPLSHFPLASPSPLHIPPLVKTCQLGGGYRQWVEGAIDRPSSLPCPPPLPHLALHLPSHWFPQCHQFKSLCLCWFMLFRWNHIVVVELHCHGCGFSMAARGL